MKFDKTVNLKQQAVVCLHKKVQPKIKIAVLPSTFVQRGLEINGFQKNYGDLEHLPLSLLVYLSVSLCVDMYDELRKDGEIRTMSLYGLCF